jgi:hypothetical protein
MKVSVNFPKEKFTKANSLTLGQLISQRKVIFGGSNEGPQKRKCSSHKFRKAVCSFSIIGPFVF